MTLEDVLNKKGIEFKPLPKKDGYIIQKEWLEKFNSDLHAKTGKWVLNNYMWEGLSENKHAVCSGKTNILYREQEVEPFYLFDEGCKHCFLCKTEEYPDFEYHDIYIFPVSKTWTMAFTHEGWAYFAT